MACLYSCPGLNRNDEMKTLFDEDTDSSQTLAMPPTWLLLFTPGVATDSPVFIVNTREDWEIMKLEVSDGFYHPVCAITRVVLDHFNVAVLVSFGVVGLTCTIYWAPFVSGKGRATRLIGFQLRSCHSFPLTLLHA